MGWTYGWNSRTQLIGHLTSTTPTQSLLAYTARGNVLWAVFSNGKAGVKQHADPKVERVTAELEGRTNWIACFLMQNGGGDDGWGYKDMEESMGPYYYTCPLRYLEMAPVACEEWRKGVREYHARQSQKIEVGNVLELERLSIKTATVERKKGRKILARADDGGLYAIPRRYIARVRSAV